MEIPFFPTQASTIAPQTDLLLVVLILLSGFFSSIVVFLIFWWSYKYHRNRPADRSNPPLTNHKVEYGWIGGLFVLAMGTFAFATIIFFNINRPPDRTLDIYVLGRQWMWKFQHLEGPREINTLHVPVNRPVRLIITSEDVIHDVYIPAFRLKQDAVPGRYTYLWFEATQTGEYHIFCAEYCGTNHSMMLGTIVIMEPRQYQDWLGGTVTGQPMSVAGQQLFSQLGCSSCHAPGAGVRAPLLEGLYGEPVPLQSGETVIADESYIRESILMPNEKIVAGYDPIMPTYEGRISEEQLLELVAYIRSLGGEEEPVGTVTP